MHPFRVIEGGCSSSRIGYSRADAERRTEMTAGAEPSPGGESAHAGLIRRLVSGDQGALSELYDSTSRLVFGLAARILNDSADAEEVTLDVYTQAWRQAARYDASRGDPITWLLTLAHSRAIDRLRSRSGAKKREQSLEAVAEFPSGARDPEASSVDAQRARLVRKAMATLSNEQREAIELAYFEGLTHVEIAERTGQPLGTAKSRIRLGMARLREALESASDFGADFGGRREPGADFRGLR